MEFILLKQFLCMRWEEASGPEQVGLVAQVSVKAGPSYPLGSDLGAGMFISVLKANAG